MIEKSATMIVLGDYATKLKSFRQRLLDGFQELTIFISALGEYTIQTNKIAIHRELFV